MTERDVETCTARAPGKVVLSGAYSVLEGAPALVTAVDRYVTADAARPASFVTPEVREALRGAPAPWFDSSSLRHRDRKLGLGSSAAILVASLGARALSQGTLLDEEELRREVFDVALEAHAFVQQGGSGVDVAASTFGGTLLVKKVSGRLSFETVRLPPDLHWEVWACDSSASTRHLIAAVWGLKARSATWFRSLMDEQARAAEDAATALVLGNADALIAALDAQRAALDKLGGAADALILTPAVRFLGTVARSESSAFLPAGAGGGDVALFVGKQPSSLRFRAQADLRGLSLLPLAFGARGLHPLDQRALK